MSKNIRIKTTPNGGDKYIKVQLEQDFDFLEVLSLKITQEEAYKNFCSDYGVVVGRVTVSSGFGVPNAKVSIFLPISEVDAIDTEIKGLYPYEIISDKNSDGIRYNLFPKTSETDNECFTPIGTFPTKREVLDNEIMTEIYEKYYKFTTTTNHAGDFMIFGVPVGNYVLHVDADLSDIGIISQRPYDNISQGTPLKKFESPTKYKGGTNLDSLVQVKSANMGVNVQPFWGSDNCEIGITRVDLDLNYQIIPSAMFTGGLFGDSHKNSVNKNCRPRKDLGTLCNQVTGEGTIEMIRETIDGKIEQFDVDGGRVIDKDGTWAYQIPMNLDYMITDEFGNLILSDNPNVGLPTRANVRFRIGMDETGGNGRLRTRAKYLVPHNPTAGKPDEIDYEFGEKTKPISFRTLYWNKIYTVSNFVSRFQPDTKVSSRAITGIKDVDGCVGVKNPFPYNKINTSFSPIFFIICLLIQIIGGVIWIINKLIIHGMNLLLSAWNGLMDVFCDISEWKVPVIKIRIFGFLDFGCKWKVDYIPCIGIKCPFDGDGEVFAPGCKGGSDEFDAMSEPPTYYPGDSFDHGGKFMDLAGLDKCVAIVMAEELNLFQFDFYNDWVNGSLFHFLIKYKRRKNSNGKFCDYDCDTFDGSSSNDCHYNYLMDVCYDGGKNSEDKEHTSGKIEEGVIKKIGDEFYYAASTHNGVFKMFATDIVNLGSVFNCDWQGVPKIQEYLIPTTYKLPPIVQELIDGTPNTVEATGQVDVGGDTNSLFFSIDCLGLTSNYRNCLNIRHICEFGVEIDEYRLNPDGTELTTDGIISVKDIDTDENGGSRVRDVLYALNKDKNNFNLNFPFETSFNLQTTDKYDFTSYNDYRGLYNNGYLLNSESTFSQPQNSFFFYFGLNPHNTGLDKLNQRFFTRCNPVVEKEFLVTVKTTTTTRNGTSDGTATIKFSNGASPFNYSISGQNGYNNVGSSDGSDVLITNLLAGQYYITATDSLGVIVTQSFTIIGPPRLYGRAVSNDATTDVSNDGIITILEVAGGINPYFYELFDNNGGVVRSVTPLVNIPTVISNLPINILTNGQTPPQYGYKLKITDSDNNSFIVSDLMINGSKVLSSDVVKTDTFCYDGNNGTITLNLKGGELPYDVTTKGPIIDGKEYVSELKVMEGLERGTYVTTAIDSQNKTLIITTQISSIKGELLVGKPDATVLVNLPIYDDNHILIEVPNYSIRFYVLKGGASGQNVNISYNINDRINSDDELIFTTVSIPFIDSTIPLSIETPKIGFNKMTIMLLDEDCESNEIVITENEIKYG